MPKLIIMRGLPASGKSTKAAELLKSHGNAVRINKDLLREMLHFGKWTGVNEGYTKAGAHVLAKAYLESGLTVIIDDTNLNYATFEGWRNLAKETGAKVEVEYLDTSVEECLRRDAAREKKVGASVIVGMALQSGLYQKPDNGIVLCDIDGTLADISHRLHFVKREPPAKKDWHGFFAGIPNDTPRTEVLDILREHQQNGLQIVLISARPETYRAETEAWLQQAFNGTIQFQVLFMRRAHDKRPDTEVKADMLRQYFRDHSWIKEVIDDRPSVIRMWREQGLNVRDVGAGIEF